MGDPFAWSAEAIAFVKGMAVTFVASLLGRLMFHARAAQRGTRRFWSWHLAWELPVAVGMGLIGDALANWLQLDNGLRAGFIAAVAYLGPHAIDEVFVTARDAARNRLDARK
ncbi:MAG: phage holin family protein [Azospirillum sp.]|nr:phage holin family protein [Azospirillum sp.]MCA3265470.1 phage holin family protein [Azospirillum sp.]